MSQDFLKVAPCSGALLYQWDGVSRHMNVAVSSRTKLVGQGYAITFGGFAEAMAYLNQPRGSVQTISVEAYRESEEELGARTMHTAIPQATFEAYAQPINGYMVRADWGGTPYVHVPTYYAYPCTQQERLALANLPETEERTGQLKWMTLSWRPTLTAANLTTDIELTYRGKVVPWSTLHHAHERDCVFLPLALMAHKGRLWNDRIERLGDT